MQYEWYNDRDTGQRKRIILGKGVLLEYDN